MKKHFLSLSAAFLSVIFVLSCTAMISFATPSASPVDLTPQSNLHDGNDNSNGNQPCAVCAALFNGTDYYKIDQGNGTNGVFTAQRSSDGLSALLTVSRTVTVSLIILKAGNYHQVYYSEDPITLHAGITYRLTSIIPNKNHNAFLAISHITIYGVADVVVSSQPSSSEEVSSALTSSQEVSSTPTSSQEVSSTPTSSQEASSTPTSSQEVSSTPTS